MSLRSGQRWGNTSVAVVGLEPTTIRIMIPLFCQLNYTAMTPAVVAKHDRGWQLYELPNDACPKAAVSPIPR